jgi:hypothetical protein
MANGWHILLTTLALSKACKKNTENSSSFFWGPYREKAAYDFVYNM